jgi:N12 class adenine-specific DNA methylase
VMAAAAMELRRMGLATKPMLVVPNHLVEQTAAEFLRLYPQARLFVAGRDHFTAGNRQKAMARIAGGDA